MPSPKALAVVKELRETEHNVEAGGYRKGPAPLALHSPKLTKAQRRIRRKKALQFNQMIFLVLNKRRLFLNGQRKYKMLGAPLDDPAYDRPQRAERNGIRRHQKRVRGRLQPLNQKKRDRTPLTANSANALEDLLRDVG